MEAQVFLKNLLPEQAQWARELNFYGTMVLTVLTILHLDVTKDYKVYYWLLLKNNLWKRQ